MTLISDTTAARALRQYARHTKTTADSKIIMIDNKLADIFTGAGWYFRSRYRLMQGRWCYVTGLKLTAAQVAQLP